MDDFLNLEKMQEKLASHEWNLYEYQVNFLKMQSLKNTDRF